MPKRSSALHPHKKSKKSHKTQKRLEAKKIMLEEKRSKKKFK